MLAAIGAGAVVEHTGAEVNVGFAVVSLVLGAAFGATGALLFAVRPGNRLGPVLLAAGTAMVAEFLLREYAYRGLPFAATAGWLGLLLDPVFFPTSVALTLLLFPDGRLPGRRLWPLPVLGLAVVGVSVGLLAIRSGPLSDLTYRYELPWHGVLPAGPASTAANVIVDQLNTVAVLLLGASLVTLLRRYRRSDADGRQRLKPLALAGSAAVAALAVQTVPGLDDVGRIALVVTVAVGFPAALAVGALRYRVWDLDPILVTAIVYGALAVLITLGYVGVVVGLSSLGYGAAGQLTGTPSLAPSIIATALVAVAFAPVRDRLSRAARRVVYGVRATPYETLAALPHRLADAPAVDEVLPRTADALARGLGVAAARVRVLIGDRHQEAWSTGSPPGPRSESREATAAPADLVVAPVRHLGEPIGDVAVRPWPDRPLRTADRRLLADLAAQAGPALRAVALTTELRTRLDQITAQSAELAASRQRIVAAQVGERRRLERDIHDGAQQRLVGLAMSISTAESIFDRDPTAARQALATCRAELDTCIDELRELARGVYPPVLAARGVGAALRARARTVHSIGSSTGSVRVALEPPADSRRYGTSVEVAVYFAALEALQNATKHAPDATVTVRLSDADGELRFVVADDGPGFDRAGVPGAANDGSGLLGMADRLGAAGGTLTIDSTPGHGTTVTGRVPAAATMTGEQ
jgi:signal transduction histidine kinase